MKEHLLKLGLTEEQADKVIENIGKIVDGQYVIKSRFNEVLQEKKSLETQLKERDVQLQELQQSEQVTEKLKEQITQLQNDNKLNSEKAAKELALERKSNAIKLELMNQVHNPDLVMKMLNMDDIMMTEEGTIKSGLKEAIAGLKKTDSYLFKDTQPNPKPEPFVKGATPKDGEGIDYSKLSTGEQLAITLAKGSNEASKTATSDIYFK